MKVYIVSMITYEDHEVIMATLEKAKAVACAKNQGTEIDFCYGDEGDPEQVLRLRYKNQSYYDYVVNQYDLR